MQQLILGIDTGDKALTLDYLKIIFTKDVQKTEFFLPESWKSVEGVTGVQQIRHWPLSRLEMEWQDFLHFYRQTKTLIRFRKIKLHDTGIKMRVLIASLFLVNNLISN